MSHQQSYVSYVSWLTHTCMSSLLVIPVDPENMKIFLTNSCLIFKSRGYDFYNFITLLTAKYELTYYWAFPIVCYYAERPAVSSGIAVHWTMPLLITRSPCPQLPGWCCGSSRGARRLNWVSRGRRWYPTTPCCRLSRQALSIAQTLKYVYHYR